MTSGVNLGALPPAAPILQGGQATLWDVLAIISCTVSNTGDFSAAEVAQLYIGIPSSPSKQLRGFSKDRQEPGCEKTVEFKLTRKDLSIWDVVQQSWVLQEGDYQIYVGASVEDIKLMGTLTI